MLVAKGHELSLPSVVGPLPWVVCRKTRVIQNSPKSTLLSLGPDVRINQVKETHRKRRGSDKDVHANEITFKGEAIPSDIFGIESPCEDAQDEGVA